MLNEPVIIFGAYCVVYTVLFIVEEPSVYNDRLQAALVAIYIIDVLSLFGMIMFGLDFTPYFLLAGSVLSSFMIHLHNNIYYNEKMLYRWAIILPSILIYLTCVLAIVLGFLKLFVVYNFNNNI